MHEKARMPPDAQFQAAERVAEFGPPGPPRLERRQVQRVGGGAERRKHGPTIPTRPETRQRRPSVLFGAVYVGGPGVGRAPEHIPGKVPQSGKAVAGVDVMLD